MKIFCLGFHKTGTTSINEAFRTLGYRVYNHRTKLHSKGILVKELKNNIFKTTMAQVEKYDFFSDMPWPVLYKRLDQKFPGSKFILTVRETKAWAKSMLNYFGAAPNLMRQWVYDDVAGCPVGSKQKFIDRYEQHNQAVIDYFAGNDNFMVFDMFGGAGWNELCGFLRCSIPSVNFPWRNKGQYV